MDRITISTFELFQMFPDKESARLYFESRMWPNGVRVPVVCQGHGGYEHGRHNGRWQIPMRALQALLSERREARSAQVWARNADRHSGDLCTRSRERRRGAGET